MKVRMGEVSYDVKIGLIFTREQGLKRDINMLNEVLPKLKYEPLKKEVLASKKMLETELKELGE